MPIAQHLLLQKLLDWTQKIQEHHLPTWDAIPTLELYMDQVIVLLNDYLESAQEKDDKGITQAMINNYVKLKVIPAPVKKRYSRVHLAYLIMVCVLKPTLSISTISGMIPVGLSEQEVHDRYCSFIENHSRALSHVTDYVQQVASMHTPEHMEDPVMQAAVSATLFKALTESVMFEPKADTPTEQK